MSICNFCNPPDETLYAPEFLNLDPSWEYFDDETDGPFSPPSKRYVRTPPSLSSMELKSLINETLLKIETCVGTYGMGGPGWVGLRISSAKIVFCQWGASNWLQLDDKLLSDYKISLSDLNWKIISIENLDGKQLKWIFEDKDGNIHTLLSLTQTTIRNGKKFIHNLDKPITDAWFMCRDDSVLWC